MKNKKLYIILGVSILILWYVWHGKKNRAKINAGATPTEPVEPEEHHEPTPSTPPVIKTPSVFPLKYGSKAPQVRVVQACINLLYVLANKQSPFKKLVASWGPLTTKEVKAWFKVEQINKTQYNAIVTFIKEIEAIQNSGGDTSVLLSQFKKTINAT